MKLVIDIDENLYTRLFDNGDTDAMDMLRACVAIRKGTPLPNNHGRLVDVYDIDKQIIVPSVLENHFTSYDIYRILENVPTIIEAESEDKE